MPIVDLESPQDQSDRIRIDVRQAHGLQFVTKVHSLGKSAVCDQCHDQAMTPSEKNPKLPVLEFAQHFAAWISAVASLARLLLDLSN